MFGLKLVWIEELRRIKKLYELSDSKAADLIQKQTREEQVIIIITLVKMGVRARGYDLCIDSGELGIDGSIELIIKVY